MEKKKTPTPATPSKGGAPSGRPAPRRHRRAHAGQVRTRSRIMRFIVSPVLLAASLACAVLAVLSFTVWRPSPTVSASASFSSRYAVSDPGVLGLVNRQASVSLHAGHKACLALSTGQDAAGWVSGRPYTRLTGLDSWTRLSAQKASATPVTGSSGKVGFQHSDLWQQVACGHSPHISTVARASSPLVVIVDTNPERGSASLAGRPARLTLSWRRTHTTDTALPLSLAAGLLLLASGLCFFIFSLSARRLRKNQVRVEDERRGPSLPAGEQEKTTGRDTPRWADDHLRSRRRRESRHRHASRHRIFAPLGARPQRRGKPVIEEPESANMVARLQETQTMAPISAPIRADGVGQRIDNGQGQPPSYMPPSSDEIQEYLRRLAQERLGGGAPTTPKGEKDRRSSAPGEENSDERKPRKGESK